MPASMPTQPKLIATPALLTAARERLAAKDPVALAFLAEAKRNMPVGYYGGSDLIWNLALAWQLTGDATFADRAIALAFDEVALGPANWSADSGFRSRNRLPALAIGFDWCWDRLSAAQITALTDYMRGWVDWIWKSGYHRANPEGNYFWGHVWGTMAVACALNDPDLLTLAEMKWKLLWSYLNTDAKGGWLHDGTSYGCGMVTNLCLAAAAYQSVKGLTLFSPPVDDLIRCRVASTLPDLKGVVPFGDQADSAKEKWTDGDLLGVRIYQAFAKEEVPQAQNWLAAVSPFSLRYYWLEWAKVLFPSSGDASLVSFPDFYVAPGAGYVVARSR